MKITLMNAFFCFWKFRILQSIIFVSLWLFIMHEIHKSSSKNCKSQNEKKEANMDKRRINRTYDIFDDNCWWSMTIAIIVIRNKITTWWCWCWWWLFVCDDVMQFVLNLVCFASMGGRYDRFGKDKLELYDSSS